MIERKALTERISRALKRSPVVLLAGPRQCGKTTIANSFASLRTRTTYFDLENPADLTALQEPMTALGPLQGLVVLDEIQRCPELFPCLRVLADRKPTRARFLVLGSASPELLRQSSESLAGRVEQVEMSGFNLEEVGAEQKQKLWQRGHYPRSFLGRTNGDSLAWRMNFVQTFLERDIPQMGFNLAAPTLRRFWTMIAHYHGQTLNASEVGRSLGVSDHTTRRYLDILAGAFMLRQLQPWHENLKKRQVKAPKVYVRDSGLLHALLGIESHRQILSHPKCGASWEGFALEEVLHAIQPREAYFWAVHSHAELDLLVFDKGKRVGFEFKFGDAPTKTRSMKIAMEDLALDKLIVVYPGERPYQLSDKIEVQPLGSIINR